MEAILVYQCGLANVFDGNFKRLLQHAYLPCEWFCQGLIKAGWKVTVMHCDVTGDIAQKGLSRWKFGPGTMFAGQKNPPQD